MPFDESTLAFGDCSLTLKGARSCPLTGDTVWNLGEARCCWEPKSFDGSDSNRVSINFASSPTDVVKIYGSNIAPTAAGVDPNGFLLYTSTNTQADQYEDGNAFIFYWAHLTSQSGGGTLTVRMLQV